MDLTITRTGQLSLPDRNPRASDKTLAERGGFVSRLFQTKLALTLGGSQMPPNHPDSVARYYLILSRDPKLQITNSALHSENLRDRRNKCNPPSECDYRGIGDCGLFEGGHSVGVLIDLFELRYLWLDSIRIFV